MIAPVSQAERGRPNRLGAVVALLALALLLGLLVAGFAAGGEAAAFAEAGLESLPFAPLAVLAYLGVERRWARYLALLWLAVLVLAFTVLGLAAGSVSLLQGLANVPERAGMPLTDVQLLPGGGRRLVTLIVGSLIALALGAICLAGSVRRGLARLLPLDPESFVHAIALSAVVSIALLCLVPLAAVGQPPLIALTNLLLAEGSALAGAQDAPVMLRTTVYALVWILPVAFICVGLGVRRGLRQAAARLGLVRLTWAQLGAGLGLALLLVAGVQVLSLALDHVWLRLGWPRTGGEGFDQAFSALLSAYMSPLGAVVLGVTAGLGEELAIRGVLQPRLGIVLSSLFFASLHAYQYNWDGLIVVFVLGLALGLIRRHSSTNVSAIAHGTYDFILIAIMLVGTSLPGQ